MFTLYQNAELYTPDSVGEKDILTWRDRIVKIGKGLSLPQDHAGRTVDLAGKKVIPALVDTHVHITGGGGEGGFTTRMTELTYEETVSAGVGCMVGVLGTDGYGRRPEDVLIKCMQIREWGIECYMLTGSYTLPVVNILGEVAKDVLFFEPILGAGELALADHRGSCMTAEELLRIACDVRNGARLAGKKGTVNIHLGNYEGAFEIMLQVAKTDITLRPVLVPTHIGRKRHVFESAMEWLEFGGGADITAGMDSNGDTLSASDALQEIWQRRGTIDKITITSDGCGSLPKFDELGNLITIEKGTSKVLLESLRDIMQKDFIPLETALLPFTKTPAQVFGFTTGAGEIKEEGKANFLVLDDGLHLQATVLNGKEVYSADAKN